MIKSFWQVWNYKLRRCLFTLLGHLDYIRTTFFHHVGFSPVACPLFGLRFKESQWQVILLYVQIVLNTFLFFFFFFFLNIIFLSPGVSVDPQCFRWPDYPHLELAVQDLCLVWHHYLQIKRLFVKIHCCCFTALQLQNKFFISSSSTVCWPAIIITWCAPSSTHPKTWWCLPVLTRQCECGIFLVRAWGTTVDRWAAAKGGRVAWLDGWGRSRSRICF